MILCLRYALAQDPVTAIPQPTLVCKPFGECEPCPEDAVSDLAAIIPVMCLNRDRSCTNPFANLLAIGASCTVPLILTSCQCGIRTRRPPHLQSLVRAKPLLGNPVAG